MDMRVSTVVAMQKFLDHSPFIGYGILAHGGDVIFDTTEHRDTVAIHYSRSHDYILVNTNHPKAKIVARSLRKLGWNSDSTDRDGWLEFFPN